MDGAIFNSGQSCCSIERVYVDEDIRRVRGSRADSPQGLQAGRPARQRDPYRPCHLEEVKETIEAHIKDAIEKGAENATPENDTFTNLPAKGNFVAPTLLIGVDHKMTVMKDETFGPVIPIMKVRE